MTERSDDEIAQDIQSVLEHYVAPYVAQHGGEVNFKEYSNGNVILEMSGACSGCAGSTATLQFGIQNILTQLVPEVKNIQGVDDPFSSIDPYMLNDHWLVENVDYLLSEDIDVDADN